ncbi:MAG: magnesium and cobalt transport protein [Caulobacteraceae bacterium]|nr:magnesium and cobalt transport protein [Caulobacteraceae bacterium]
MLLKIPPPGGGNDRPVWLDLLNPTDVERSEAEAETGFSLPTLDQLSEIEASSRLRFRDGVLIMSTPMIAHMGPHARGLAPIGFVLSAEKLVTIRFSPLKSFDDVARELEESGVPSLHSLEIFVRLCEDMVDRMADALEGLSASLDELSAAVFNTDEAQPPTKDRTNSRLREQLKRVGQMGDKASNTRDALLGLGRILAFVEENAKNWNEGRCAPRIASLRQDVHSLNDYDAQLSDKVQFLLDALVGMIGIAQNDIFKILTIVSIVGIPPTLVASIYGMNFKSMPELSWVHGYPYGLAVIAISAIIPVVWFKLRGWF